MTPEEYEAEVLSVMYPYKIDEDDLDISYYDDRRVSA